MRAPDWLWPEIKNGLQGGAWLLLGRPAALHYLGNKTRPLWHSYVAMPLTLPLLLLLGLLHYWWPDSTVPFFTLGKLAPLYILLVWFGFIGVMQALLPIINRDERRREFIAAFNWAQPVGALMLIIGSLLAIFLPSYGAAFNGLIALLYLFYMLQLFKIALDVPYKMAGSLLGLYLAMSGAAWWLTMI